MTILLNIMEVGPSLYKSLGQAILSSEDWQNTEINSVSQPLKLDQSDWSLQTSKQQLANDKAVYTCMTLFPQTRGEMAPDLILFCPFWGPDTGGLRRPVSTQFVKDQLEINRADPNKFWDTIKHVFGGDMKNNTLHLLDNLNNPIP